MTSSRQKGLQQRELICTRLKTGSLELRLRRPELTIKLWIRTTHDVVGGWNHCVWIQHSSTEEGARDARVPFDIQFVAFSRIVGATEIIRPENARFVHALPAQVIDPVPISGEGAALHHRPRRWKYGNWRGVRELRTLLVRRDEIHALVGGVGNEQTIGQDRGA